MVSKAIAFMLSLGSPLSLGAVLDLAASVDVKALLFPITSVGFSACLRTLDLLLVTIPELSDRQTASHIGHLLLFLKCVAIHFL